MSKPPNFRNIDCCEYCKFISWTTRKDAWCTKHELDLNPAHETRILTICDDFKDEEEHKLK